MKIFYLLLIINFCFSQSKEKNYYKNPFSYNKVLEKKVCLVVNGTISSFSKFKDIEESKILSLNIYTNTDTIKKYSQKNNVEKVIIIKLKN